MIHTVTIIIPAFNEEKFLPKVLRDLLAIQTQSQSGKAYVISDIIVVNDGSTDHTERVAKEMGVSIVKLGMNFGKAFAFFKGVQKAAESKPSIMVSFDGDLGGISTTQFEQLIAPIIIRKRKMAIGMVENDNANVSGQRAFDMSVFDPLLKGNRKWEKYFGIRRGQFLSKAGYGLEQALNILIKNSEKVWTTFKTARDMGRVEYARYTIREFLEQSNLVEQGRDFNRVWRIEAKRKNLAKKIKYLRQKQTSISKEKLVAYRKRLQKRIRSIPK